MKPYIKTTYTLICLLIVVTGCSRKNNTFFSRNYHAVTTEFNTLFNGQNAFNDGLAAISSDYFDNYWEVLPVERLKIRDEILAPGQFSNDNFEIAEEKATKAIQKHSIDVDGKEKNPQIDEAYLLLGKARYFDQRFVPALDAFNQILFKYPASDKINAAKIWREKVNIRLENNELAIENLKRLLEQEELKNQDLANATSSLAQAYLNQQYIDSAVTQLEYAATYTKNNEERGRYRFIQGQLYNALGKKDSANYAFDKVIELNRRTPRIYLISAYLEKIKNFDYDNGNKIELLEHLTKLEENRENRPYLDKIYYQIASYHNQNESDTLAELYFNKSLRTNSSDRLLVAKNYEAIGNLNFDKTIFKRAGSYYDSTLVNLEENTKLYRSIRKKRDNLEDVIFYEDAAQRNDSILTLVRLPEDERIEFFTTYVDSLKVIAEAQAEAQKKIGALANNNTSNSNALFPNNGANTNQATNSGGTFYFYNPATVAFGKNDFRQRWPNRSLQDNWRFSGGPTRLAGGPLTGANTDATSVDAEKVFDPQFYISQIPTDEKEIDSIQRDRNFAYYQLGLIYKEKFREYNLAKDRLQTVLKSNPEERLILPSKYNLFKIYELLGLQDEARIARQDIIDKHPQSRYASILLNPESVISEDENSPENIYERVYAQFQEQNYQEVIQQSDTYITRFDGEAIVPKFEFLKAISRARLFGFEAYKEGVNFIALNYPNSEEGKRASEMLQTVFPLLESKNFVADDGGTNFKVLYQFENISNEDLETFTKHLNTVIEDVKHFGLSTSKDIYNNNTIFVVVHGFNSIQGASGFSDFLKDSQNGLTSEQKQEKEDAYKEVLSKNYIPIASKNYEVIQIHKNLDAYLKLNSN